MRVNERVIINCGPLIDSANEPNPIVNWYHNHLGLSNGSAINVVISQDERLCTIAETSVGTGGGLGNGGNYTCEICGNLSNCISRSTITEICGKILMYKAVKYFKHYLYIGEPNLEKPPPFSLMVSMQSSFAFVRCGQNVTIPSSGVASLLFSCPIFNGTDPITREVFKNGASIGSEFSIRFAPFDYDDFGNYTFVASTRCGSTSAVSWILPGQLI